MTASSFLRQARRSRGLTQRDLAHRSGVAQSAIAKIESGVTVPRVDTLERLLASCEHKLDIHAAIPAVDPDDWALVLANLQLTPRERLAQVKAWAAFTSKLRAAGRVHRGE